MKECGVRVRVGRRTTFSFSALMENDGQTSEGMSSRKGGKVTQVAKGRRRQVRGREKDRTNLLTVLKFVAIFGSCSCSQEERS